VTSRERAPVETRVIYTDGHRRVLEGPCYTCPCGASVIWGSAAAEAQAKAWVVEHDPHGPLTLLVLAEGGALLDPKTRAPIVPALPDVACALLDRPPRTVNGEALPEVRGRHVHVEVCIFDGGRDAGAWVAAYYALADHLGDVAGAVEVTSRAVFLDATPAPAAALAVVDPEAADDAWARQAWEDDRPERDADAHAPHGLDGLGEFDGPPSDELPDLGATP